MDNIKLLEDYVGSANPIINVELRKGIVSQDALLFDTLFKFGNVPSKLYRWMPDCYLRVVNGFYKDPAYLSCSENVDNFFNHVDGDNIACLVIKMPSMAKHINIKKELPNHNDEGEYILPRDVQLRINKQETIDTLNQIELFISREKGMVSAMVLAGAGITRISVYYMEMNI